MSPFFPVAKLGKVYDCLDRRCVHNAEVIFKQFGGQLLASKPSLPHKEGNEICNHSYHPITLS